MCFSVIELELLLEKSNINDIEYMIIFWIFMEFFYFNWFYNLFFKLYNENKIFYYKLICKICLWLYLYEKYLKIEYFGSIMFDVNVIVIVFLIFLFVWFWFELVMIR